MRPSSHHSTQEGSMKGQNPSSFTSLFPEGFCRDDGTGPPSFPYYFSLLPALVKVVPFPFLPLVGRIRRILIISHLGRERIWCFIIILLSHSTISAPFPRLITHALHYLFLYVWRACVVSDETRYHKKYIIWWRRERTSNNYPQRK